MLCPAGTTLLLNFTLNGETSAWLACEDLQRPGGAIALVSSSATEWFSKSYSVYGSAHDDDYYLNYTKAQAVSAKADVLALKLLETDVTWQRVASAVPPIRKAGVRTFVGSRGSVEKL